jgi:hypothetical protein
MPSSGVSDGVQSLIVEKFPGTIFCAVETSGDGAVNFQSRVQMYLSKAKQAAQEELNRTLSERGITLDQVRDLLKRNRQLRSPLHVAPHHGTTRVTDIVSEAAGLQVPLAGRAWNRLAHGLETAFRSVSVFATRKGPSAANALVTGSDSAQAERSPETRRSAKSLAKIAA